MAQALFLPTRGAAGIPGQTGQGPRSLAAGGGGEIAQARAQVRYEGLKKGGGWDSSITWPLGSAPPHRAWSSQPPGPSDIVTAFPPAHRSETHTSSWRWQQSLSTFKTGRILGWGRGAPCHPNISIMLSSTSTWHSLSPTGNGWGCCSGFDSCPDPAGQIMGWRQMRAASPAHAPVGLTTGLQSFEQGRRVPHRREMKCFRKGSAFPQPSTHVRDTRSEI